MADLELAAQNAVVGCLVRTLLDEGFTIEVWNGGDSAEYVGTDLEQVLTELEATEEDMLYVSRDDGQRVPAQGWVRLIYGNGEYVINDYTTNLEEVLTPVNALVELFEEGEVVALTRNQAREMISILDDVLTTSHTQNDDVQAIINLLKGVLR